MPSELTVDDLPPLEASVTGIERAEPQSGSTSRVDVSTAQGSTSRSTSNERPVSSTPSRKSKPLLHKYWDALHHAVAPELSLVASEDQPASAPDTPLGSANLRDAGKAGPLAAAGAAAASTPRPAPISRPSSSASRRGVDTTSKSDPSTSRSHESHQQTDFPSKPEFLAVDRDFDELLSTPVEAEPEFATEASPRNSISRPVSLQQTDSTINNKATVNGEPRPPLSAERLSSGNISAETAYPPPSLGGPELSSAFGRKTNERKSCLVRTFRFMHPHFKEPAMEKAFRKETWQVLKPAAIASSTIVFMLWCAYSASKPIQIPLYKALFYGIDVSFNVLMVIVIVLDLYLRLPWLYQFIAFVNCWALPCTILAASYQCHFFYKLDHSSSICPPERDFLSVLLWPLAFPVIHLFLLSAWRGPTFMGFCIWFGISIWTIIVPENKSFGVNLINVALFQLAIFWVSLLKERSDRHMFLLHERVRRQFRQTKQAQKRERSAEISKQAFVSYIFHEVRIPLNAALLACQNLEAENLLGRIPEHKVMSRGLSSSLLTMQRVLNDILDYQKMESRRLAWNPSPFNLHSTLKAVVESYRPFADSRRLSLATDFDNRIDRLARVLMGDPHRVAQAVSNLLSNACKWGKSKVICNTQLLFPLQSASLDVPVRAALIRVEVRDDGDGIHPEDLEDQKLFSPYVQTGTQLKAGGKGAGLGLALTKENVKLAGGRLGVDSQPGAGATFWFEMVFGLPIEKLEPTTLNVTPIVPPTYILGSPGLAAGPPSPGLQSKKKSLQILLADDDPLTCKLMQRMLGRQGHDAVIASTGKEAVDIVKSTAAGTFDLALLDGNIGDMTGWECLKELEAHGFEGYACGLSGSADAKEPFEAAGAQNTLLKPLNGEALDRLLAEVVAFRDQRKE